MTPRNADECLFHWHAVVSTARTPWDRKFSKEIAEKAIKPWWRPSVKQLEVMRRMIGELFGETDNSAEVIERG